MTALSTNHLLRRSVLVFLLALYGCATVSDKATVGNGPAAAAAPPATPPAAKAARAAEVPEPAKPENTKIYKGTGILAKPPNPDEQPAERGEISLNFEAVDAREIAKAVLADILGEAYIVDPTVQGTISFRSSRPLPRSALLPTLETVLRMNGIVIVKENNIFKIMPANAVRGSLSPKTGMVPGYSVQVVPLQYIGSREMAKILEPFAPDASAIKADELRNFVIISGTQNEIRHMLDTIEMFDVDWLSGMSVGLFSLQNTDVKTVDAELSKILGDAQLNPLAGAVRLIPIERLNGFIVITPQPHYLEQAKLWLERLDRTGGAGGGERLYVYHVQNGKADHLADLLNQTFGGGATTTTRTTTVPSLAPGLAPTDVRSSGPMSTPSTTTTTTRGALGGTTGGTLGSRTGSSVGSTLDGTTARSSAGIATTRPSVTGTPVTGTTLSVTGDSGVPEAGVRVVADKENNALVIVATPAAYDKILAALKKLDNAPRQVLIEAALVEVTLTDELSYGTEWLFTKGSRRSGQLDTGSRGLSKLVPGFSYALTAAGSDQIKAVLNMFGSDNRANLLASPHIMVTDNQTAKIQVGDSVPTAGPQSVSGTGVIVSSVQYVETGVLLSVTPRINAGGLVNLEINQEVSTAIPTETSSLDSPTISKRTAQTSLAVQSGETVVMGGLIRDNSSAGSSGLPFLSRIPILGALFGTQSRNSSKVELVLLITPRVAENAAQAKQLSDEFRTKMRQAEELRKCGTSNVFGYTSRGGLWCLEADRVGAKTGQQPVQ